MRQSFIIGALLASGVLASTVAYTAPPFDADRRPFDPEHDGQYTDERVNRFYTEGKELSVTDVPPHVLRAARRAAGRRPIRSVEIDYEDREMPVFEFQVDTWDRKAMEVDVREDGSVEEIEYEIAMADVPQKVVAALLDRMPDFQPSYIERVVRPAYWNHRGGTYFRFTGLDEDARTEIMVEISAKGDDVVVDHRLI